MNSLFDVVLPSQTVVGNPSGSTRNAEAIPLTALYPNNSPTFVTITATTSVVTPLVGTDTATAINIKYNGSVILTSDNNHTEPAIDGFILGAVTKRFQFIGTSLDSGTTGSLSLKTNNGTEQARAIHTANAVNFLGMQGGAAGGAVTLWFAGGDANVQAQYNVLGSAAHVFTTGSTALSGAGLGTQFQILHTASATRNINITGSNGGNPTISTTGGNLAIASPSVVLTGVGSFVSAGPNSSQSAGFNVPYLTGYNSRNSANNADINVFFVSTVNTITDVLTVGFGSGGIVGVGRSRNAAPTTSDLAAGQWAVWRDTVGATTKLYYNNAGAIQSVALA